MQTIAIQVLKWILGIELAYLLLVNTALQLDLTQDLVNKIRPEKFQVSWQDAWSWYPFRVSAEGIVANGQSRSQQWELRAEAASGSIRLLPLVLKRVYLSDLHAQSVDYRQRPRLKADRDYTRTLAHFPDIPGREIQPADVSPRKQKRPWKVRITDATAAGEHTFWIYNLQGGGSGSLAAEFNIETRGGPFSLDMQEVALQLDPAFVNGDTELFHGGSVRGAMAFDPFVPRDNKGLRMLPFVRLDASVDLQVASLAFINLFTANLGNMVISGAGKVAGSVVMSEGYLRAGTDLKASAGELSVVIREMDVSGDGLVRIHTPENADKPLGLDIDYRALTVTRLGDVDPFLAGDSLALAFSGSNFIALDPDMDFAALMDDERSRERRKNNTLKVLVDDATLLDMSIINDYMPSHLPLKFMGGTAQLQTDLFVGVSDMNGLIELDSSNALLAIDNQTLRADLDADLIIAGGVPREFKVDMSGSRVVLDKVRVQGEHEDFSSDDWSAVLAMKEVQAIVQNPLQLHAEAELQVSDTRPLVAMFDNRGDPPQWISGLMTLKDLSGEATIDLDGKRLVLPRAYVTSDKAEVAAKALFSGGVQNSVVYARYNKLDLLLRTENNERNIDVINVREKFEKYRLPVD